MCSDLKSQQTELNRWLPIQVEDSAFQGLEWNLNARCILEYTKYMKQSPVPVLFFTQNPSSLIPPHHLLPIKENPNTTQGIKEYSE